MRKLTFRTFCSIFTITFRAQREGLRKTLERSIIMTLNLEARLAAQQQLLVDIGLDSVAVQRMVNDAESNYNAGRNAESKITIDCTRLSKDVNRKLSRFSHDELEVAIKSALEQDENIAWAIVIPFAKEIAVRIAVKTTP